MTTHTGHFDELIHAPTRLRICAALGAATELEFAVLEDALEISTSLLSKQLKLLVDAGYVEVEKRPQTFGRPRSWVRFTRRGRRAYSDHVDALRQLVTLPD